MKRTFASLEPREALHIAIFIEERNAEVYHRFAEMFTEFKDRDALEISDVFWEMAVEERGHHSMLKQKYAERFGDQVCSLTEEDLVELIEVPKFDLSDVLTGDPADTARHRALQVAMQAELSALAYYETLVEQTSDERLRHVYRELAKMEDGHVAFLAAKLEAVETDLEDTLLH